MPITIKITLCVLVLGSYVSMDGPCTCYQVIYTRNKSHKLLKSTHDVKLPYTSCELSPRTLDA